ncbi:hypothetical protein HMPREF9061_01151 [Actinomyces sp. oral taxon 181 str. F0379]|nr:hypothetical protein HMPREF9061_01151 [Actinomyces sp. oral taxon 181 str. F0379]
MWALLQLFRAAILRRNDLMIVTPQAYCLEGLIRGVSSPKYDGNPPFPTMISITENLLAIHKHPSPTQLQVSGPTMSK